MDSCTHGNKDYMWCEKEGGGWSKCSSKTIYFMLEYRSNALCIWSFLNCEYDLLLQNVTI